MTQPTVVQVQFNPVKLECNMLSHDKNNMMQLQGMSMLSTQAWGCNITIHHINNESYPTEHGILTNMNITSTYFSET